MLKTKSDYYTFLVILYLFVTQFVTMRYFTVFKYWDELYAVLSIPVFIWVYKERLISVFRNFQKKAFDFKKCVNQKLKSTRIKVLVGITNFVLIGLIGNIVYRYQVFSAIAVDVLLNVKFVLGIFTTYYIFKNQQIFKYKREILRHVHIIIVVLFVLLIFDIIFQVFPCNEIRYGLRSKQLFYSHPTELASVSFFLLLLNALFSVKISKKEIIFTVLASVLVASSLRFKAIVSVLFFLLVWFWIVLMKKRVKSWQILIFVPFAIYFAWDQIFFYFFSDASKNTARGALSFASIEILKDYFPIGTGLGTFASAPSGDYYSKVYYLYELSHVWGLTPADPAHVSDVFWPMILGQAGILGLIVYIYIIGVLFKEITGFLKTNKNIYLAGIGALVYLLISSVAESAFVNPLALPLSLIIGLCMLFNETELQKNDERKNKT